MLSLEGAYLNLTIPNIPLVDKSHVRLNALTLVLVAFSFSALSEDRYLTDSDHMNSVLEQLRGMSLSKYGSEFVKKIDEKAAAEFVNSQLGKAYLDKFNCSQMYKHIDLSRAERPEGSQYANYAADPQGFTLQYYYVLYISEEMGIFRFLERSRLYRELSSADNFVMTIKDGVGVSLKDYANSDRCTDSGFWRLYNVIGARIIEDYISVLGHAAVEGLPYEY